MRFVPPLSTIVLTACLAGCGSAPSYYAYNGPRPSASYSRSLGLYVPAHVATYSALPQSTDVAAAYTPSRHVALRSRPAAQTPAAASAQPRTDAVAVTNDQQDADAPLPFTPEWWAHEKATDDKLKKSLTICSGC